MEGRSLAAVRRYEASLAQAWHTEAFAREKRLKPLAKYLSSNKAKPAQGPTEMLATLREIQSRGAPMTIRKVARA